ncbi:MAG: choloylglycine hydrolase, partial [Clostridia bacterium]|nr:choloylglycine hydrolase [Clostridia bacterium]
MCTAITYKTNHHYFGRNLDLEYHFNETVTITPRNYTFRFRKMGEIKHHFAIIGMAYVFADYPLYYDATNEKGLSVAALNFPKNAHYSPYCLDKDNITPFELIPWVLSQCATVYEAQKLLNRINLLNQSFSEELPLSPLHWIISDSRRSITLEPLKSGIKIVSNPVGVLTNNPPFNYQLFNLNNYMSLTNAQPKSTFLGSNKALKLEKYSRGMGAMGLPGDFSSASRFIKATFVKMNSVPHNTEAESINQFFHILKSVEMPKGCLKLKKELYAFTIYSSCCNTDLGIYY